MASSAVPLPADQPALLPVSSTHLLISYKELVEIRSTMARMEAMLQVAIALQGEVTSLTRRVASIETRLGYSDGARSTRNTILAYGAGLVSAAIGTALINFVPKMF